MRRFSNRSGFCSVRELENIRQRESLANLGKSDPLLYFHSSDLLLFSSLGQTEASAASRPDAGLRYRWRVHPGRGIRPANRVVSRVVCLSRLAKTWGTRVGRCGRCMCHRIRSLSVATCFCA